MCASLVIWRRRAPLVRLLLLVVLLFRAYVPAGFMPASGMPFRLALCPASTPMPAHHHPGGPHQHVDVCPFGSASTAGPVSHGLPYSAGVPAGACAAPASESWLGGLRLAVAHAPRGPPDAVRPDA